jgi:hypothetical protein
MSSRHIQSPSGLELTREEATSQLWSLALMHRQTRQELAKTNYVDVASKMLDAGLPEEQHVASGLLAVMAEDEECGDLQLLFRTSTEARVLTFIKRCFQVECPHDRSKVCIALLTYCCVMYALLPVSVCEIIGLCTSSSVASCFCFALHALHVLQLLTMMQH